MNFYNRNKCFNILSLVAVFHSQDMFSALLHLRSIFSNSHQYKLRNWKLFQRSFPAIVDNSFGVNETLKSTIFLATHFYTQMTTKIDIPIRWKLYTYVIFHKRLGAYKWLAFQRIREIIDSGCDTRLSGFSIQIA